MAPISIHFYYVIDSFYSTSWADGVIQFLFIILASELSFNWLAIIQWCRCHAIARLMGFIVFGSDKTQC
jgi:hypothetical protein